jgi:signal transduction histidine kinase
MGLALVARIAERLAGATGVESNVPKGSRFWIELPAG